MARRSRRRVAFTERNPVVIALLGIVAITLVLTLTVQWRKLPFVDDSVSFRAEFTDASGLVAGEEVRVAGVKVGTVDKISLEGEIVVVDFSVSGVLLGDDTEAGIEIKTLLGQHYLSVVPGGDAELDEGATIPLERTRTPVNIVPAFNRLTDQVARTETEQVAVAFDALAETLRTTAPEMEGALTGLSRLARSVNKRDQQIAQLFERTADVTGVVAARDEDLAALLTASDEVLVFLDERKAILRRVISGTRALARELGGLFDDNQEAIGPALRDLRVTLQILKRNEKALETTVEYATVYGREFTSVGGTGEWFDATMKFPRGFAVCSTGDSSDITQGILEPLLSVINQAVNGSSTPCLPLGPAVADRLAETVPGGVSR